jgi:hypothetical protein
MSWAERDILRERARQIEDEGFDTEHDDAHTESELERAAATYALANWYTYQEISQSWPWDRRWWKPATHRRNLVKAAALLIAAIERIDRRG